MRAALHRPPATIATDLAQPLAVVTAWQGFGAELWGVLGLSVAVACAGVLAVLRLLRTANVDARIVLAMIAATTLLALAAALSWPVVFSSDVYAYAAYGDEALRGLDPYAPLPAHVSDSFLTAAAWQWSGAFPVCVYGSVFVAFAQALVAPVRAFGVGPTLLAFRLAACLAFLIACACFFFLLPTRNAGRAAQLAPVAAFALNPVALWTVAEGHNDALMLALALAGAAIAARGFPALGGVSMGLAGLVKLPGIAIGLAVAAFNELEAKRRLQRIWPAFATSAILVAAFAVPHALAVAREFSGRAHYAPQFSFQALSATALSSLWSNGAAATVGIAFALLVCIALAVRGISLAISGDSGGIALIGIAVWLATPNPYPWYALWVLPLAALALERVALAALWAGTICVVARYLPDAYGTLSSAQQMVIALVIVAPLLYALRALRTVASSEKLATS